MGKAGRHFFEAAFLLPWGKEPYPECLSGQSWAKLGKLHRNPQRDQSDLAFGVPLAGDSVQINPGPLVYNR